MQFPCNGTRESPNMMSTEVSHCALLLCDHPHRAVTAGQQPWLETCVHEGIGGCSKGVICILTAVVSVLHTRRNTHSDGPSCCARDPDLVGVHEARFHHWVTRLGQIAEVHVFPNLDIADSVMESVLELEGGVYCGHAGSRIACYT